MLQLLALRIPDVLNFDFVSKPSPGKYMYITTVSELTKQFISRTTQWLFNCMTSSEIKGFNAVRLNKTAHVVKVLH